MTLGERLKALMVPGSRKARRAARIVFDDQVRAEAKDLLVEVVRALKDGEIDEEERSLVVEALESVAGALRAARTKTGSS